MDDSKIIELYFARDEAAILETADKYGRGLFRLSLNITESASDSEECVNDTYLEAWRCIPPTKPERLFAWLSRVVRNLSYKRWERQSAAKRSTKLTAITDELSECIPSGESVPDICEAKRLSHCIDAFLAGLGCDSRLVFMRRYFWSESLADISASTGWSQSKLKSMLFRTRAGLRKALEREDFEL